MSHSRPNLCKMIFPCTFQSSGMQENIVPIDVNVHIYCDIVTVLVHQ